jgi:hypothetical protein
VAGEYLITVAPDAGEAPVRERFGSLGIARVQALGPNLLLVKLQPARASRRSRGSGPGTAG